MKSSSITRYLRGADLEDRYRFETEERQREDSRRERQEARDRFADINFGNIEGHNTVNAGVALFLDEDLFLLWLERKGQDNASRELLIEANSSLFKLRCGLGMEKAAIFEGILDGPVSSAPESTYMSPEKLEAFNGFLGNVVGRLGLQPAAALKV